MIERVKEESSHEARKVAFSPLVEAWTRVGFGARGLIYFTMGLLALEVVLGKRASPADQQGALAALGANPLGRVLLVLVLVGLAGYALWGFIRTFFDPLHMGSDATGFIERLGNLVSPISYASLILPTYHLLNGSGKAAHNGAQTAATQSLASRLLATAWGPFLLGLAGVVIFGIGVGQLFQALSRKFDKQFQMYDLSPHQARWIKRLGRIGIVARGIVFGMVGLFLVIAAWQLDPSKAQGLNGALGKLLQLPYGYYLLGLVAVGLMAYGIYSMAGALWFRFKQGGRRP